MCTINILHARGINYPPEFVTSVIDFFDGDTKKAKFALYYLPSQKQKPINSGSLIACMRQALPDVSDEDLDLAFILGNFNFIEGIKLLKTPKSDRIPCENPAPSIPNFDKEEKLLEKLLPEYMRCPECHKMMCSFREPVILLPCKHTVCSCCARYACPICKQKIKKYNKNFLLATLLEKILNHERIDDCMECQICAEMFNQDRRKPVTLLPCGHSLCQSCLIHWNRYRCPFCRQIFNEKIDNQIIFQLSKDHLDIIKEMNERKRIFQKIFRARKHKG